MRVILGIDPGLACTGFGILEIEGNRQKHIEHGVISTEAGQPRGLRLTTIYNTLDGIIHRFKPTEAGLESLFFAKNTKTAFAVAEARGVIQMCLSIRDVPCTEYTPLQVKQAVVGGGRAEKRQIQHMIKMIFRLSEIPKPDDAADALAIALCHANNSQMQWAIRSARTRHV